MKTRSGKSLPRSVASVLLLLTGLINSPQGAAQENDQDTTYQDIGKKLIDYGNNLDNTAKDMKSDREAINLELKRLQDLVDKKEISIEQAIQQSEALESKIQLSEEKQKELNDKYKEIDSNFNKYVFQTRAEKILPFFYAVAAIAASNGDNNQKVLYGLAGYGTGALIENTGYGISAGITWVKYKWFY